MGTPSSGAIGAGMTLGGVTMGLGSDATGDIYYNNGGVLTRLPKGTNGQALELVSGIPAWATISGTGTVNAAGTGLSLSGGGTTLNLALTNATYQTAAGSLPNPTSTTSTSAFKMMGMDSTFKLTPVYSSRILVTITGYLQNTIHRQKSPIARKLPLSPMHVLRVPPVAPMTPLASRRVRAARPLLPKVIRVTENFRSSMNHFDCARAHPFQSRDGAVLTMLTVIAGIFIVLSIGILVVHALDGFRSN